MELDELVGKIERNPVSLFYGAGVSMACGGPSGPDLLLSIKSRFGDFGGGSFFEYMDGYIEDDDSNRNKIEDYLKEKLASISPEDTHRFLFSLPWKAVLTTNYDHLPEIIYQTIDRNRTIVSISDPDSSSIDQTRRDVLYCFKLMGDVKYSYPNGGWPVLTNRDLKYAYDRRSKFIKLFRNLSTSGHIIYLGYSFNDNFVFDVLHEMKHVLKEIPWKGYAIMPDEPKPEMKERMQKYGVVWVKGNLDDFVLVSKKHFGDVPISAPSLVEGFKVHNVPIELDKGTASNIWGKYKVLTDANLSPQSENPQDFFEGIDSTSFYPFAQRWDYPRKVKPVYRNPENKRVGHLGFKDLLELSKSGNSSDNIVMTLTGSAGSGKTVIAKRLAFDWYRYGNPVIFINTKTISLDTRVLEGLLDEIWGKYKKEADSRDKVMKSLRFLLVADDCSDHFEVLAGLKNLLISIGKPADMLLISRKSELQIDDIKKNAIDLAFEVDDTIDQSELTKLTDHFAKYNVLKDPVIVKKNLEDPTINTSFFALIYTSVKGINKSLKTIILDEFKKLDATSKRIYSLVSLLQSFTLIPYFSICIKCGNFKTENLLKKITKGNLTGIINYSTDSYKIERFPRIYGMGFGEDALFTRNKIIADIIYTHVFSRSGLVYPMLQDIISAVTLDDEVEVGLLHMLLIEKVRKGVIPELETIQRISLFKQAIKEIKSRPLLHHLAKLQMHSGHYQDADLTLKDALYASHGRFSEKRENVIDSMARLELLLAEEAVNDKHEDKAWKHLDRAERLFGDASINPLETPHPYQGLGKTYLAKAQLSADENTQMSYYLLTLRECSYVENNADSQSISAWYSLKSKAIQELGRMGFNKEKASRILSHMRNGDGYAFLAEYEISKKNYTSALELVDEGLSKHADSLWLIRTKVYITRRLSPEDYKTLRRELNEFLRIPGDRFDIMLSFELAMVTFKLGEYKISRKLFKELYSRSKYIRHRLRPTEINRWTEGGSPKEFHGVVRKPPRAGEFGWIECTTLVNFEDDIPVRKTDIEFELQGNDRVVFNLIFNMAGPQASRVRKHA